jgi:general secretion pathway protein G
MTLVEVLAVVVILGLLAGTLLVGFSATFGKAKTELAKTGVGVVAGKLELHRIERGAYPANDVGLAALGEPLATPAQSYYLPKDKLVDPWGREWLYVVPGPNGHPYEVLTYGADGQPGGVGEDLDISSAHLREGDTR